VLGRLFGFGTPQFDRVGNRNFKLRKGVETMFGKKKAIIAAAVLGALVFGSRSLMADSISIQNNGTPITVAPGVALYSYTVTFDSDDTLDTNATTTTGTDGFEIVDFGAADSGYVVNGYTLTYSAAKSSIVDSDPTLASDFTGSQPSTGTSLNGYDVAASNGTTLVYGQTPEVDPANTPDASVNDTSAANVLFSYNGNGGVDFAPNPDGTTVLILNVYSQIVTYTPKGQSLGVDNNGDFGSVGAESIAFTDNPVNVPEVGGPLVAVPLPLSSVGGGVLFGLFGLTRMVKARRLDA